MRRAPATTSSPWAFSRKSPSGSGSPVEAFRDMATPAPESLPMFPNTMAWMLTAVPRSLGMPAARRYSRARFPFHERNTAAVARRSCSAGSVGKASPV